MKTHNASLEEFKSKAELENIKYYQQLYLSTSTKRRQALAKNEVPEVKTIDNFEYLPIEEPVYKPELNKYKKFEPVYGNYTQQINGRLP
jgi:hypothetical protein